MASQQRRDDVVPPSTRTFKYYSPRWLVLEWVCVIWIVMVVVLLGWVLNPVSGHASMSKNVLHTSSPHTQQLNLRVLKVTFEGIKPSAPPIGVYSPASETTPLVAVVTVRRWVRSVLRQFVRPKEATWCTGPNGSGI